MNYWSHIARVFCMLQVAHAGTTHTSKACYGVAGLPCTEHKISCNNTQKIDIKEAYYTDNTDCTRDGLTHCKNVTPDNVIESGKHSFNTAEMSFLKNKCSTSCLYRALRRNETLSFSVVRYECSEEVRFTTAPTEDISLVSTSSRFPAGLFVGGVAVGGVMVILVGLAVYVLIVRPRYNLTPKKQGDTPASVEHPTYSGMSAGGDVNNYDIIEQTSGFRGDTAHDLVSTPEYKNI
ncbi:uncharacterized protein LOC124130087 isoform X1 [Haliotis rufescens]|uniref:uncharacterized protein LOC124130087 isoform X1 n=1 Tax=Haliotis rufescens TaxID=6454 RepID=UPI00201F94A1|nr:uncharacterized protein LOC124130087 isoform X1 [Haliotis rufescens]